MNVVGRKIIITDRCIWKNYIGIIIAQFRTSYKIHIIKNNYIMNFMKDEVSVLDNDNNYLVNVDKYSFCYWCATELKCEFLDLNNREFYIWYCPKCLR